MQLSNEQLVRLAGMLSEALETVLYAYDKDIVVDDDMVKALRKVVLNSKELLGK
jgi:hypothetical protein